MKRSRDQKKRVRTRAKAEGVVYTAALRRELRSRYEQLLATFGGHRRLWSEALDGMPAEVTDHAEIRRWLNQVARAPNHMFHTRSGGLDLDAVNAGPAGLDEFWLRGVSLGEGHPSFWAKIARLRLVGTREMARGVLIELEDLGHAELEDGVTEDNMLADDDPPRKRLNRGTLLVVWKHSAYNGLSGTYDARHVWLHPDELGGYLDALDRIREKICAKLEKDSQLRAGQAAGAFVSRYDRYLSYPCESRAHALAHVTAAHEVCASIERVD